MRRITLPLAFFAVGSRPLHLSRRGAIYLVRFRIPILLTDKLEMVELRKSLHTASPQEARRRCLRATVWFRQTMEKLDQNPAANRALLEEAAIAFFAELAAEIDQPRDFHHDDFENIVAMNVEATRDRIDELQTQLVTRKFERAAEIGGEKLAAAIGQEFGEMGSAARQGAMELAARAETEQMRLLIHLLTSPATRYQPADGLFQPRARPLERAVAVAVASTAEAQISLRAATAQYLSIKAAQKVGPSQIEEIGRALRWLGEEIGVDTPLAAILKSDLRDVRTDFARLDSTKRGRAMPFKDRLSDDPARQISSYSATRYRRSIQAFFRWAFEEDHIAQDPAATLKIAVKKGEVKRTPAPFSNDELSQLFAAPLYAGYQSVSRLTFPGKIHRRLEHWWSGILPMFTGLRASELAQLLPSDFVFDGDLPHVKIRREDDEGNVVKTTKTEASVRNVPLHPILLQLGLREFVARQAKASKERVFRSIARGTHRSSTGLTKFWTKVLKGAGVWKPGRATHVWRHTVVACLRRNGVPEEDVAAVVGHSRQSVTAGYGGAYPLSRLSDSIARLDYGFDVVGALGGAFDPKRHG